MKITWLHLSDLHFGRDRYNEDVVINSFFEDIEKQRAERNFLLDFIFITGDITFSGQKHEFDLAKAFIDKLSSTTSVPLDNIIIVPGNHDISRASISFSAKNSLSAIRDRDTVRRIIEKSDDLIEYLRPMQNFKDFTKDFIWTGLESASPLSFTINRNIKDISVSILALNSAWLAYGEINEKGTLVIGESQVRDALHKAEQPDLIISLMHHPFDWLKDFDSMDCKSILDQNVDYILSGHTHETEIIGKPWGGRALRISAGATYHNREHSNSYNIVTHDYTNGTATLVARKYFDKHGGVWLKDNTLVYGNEEGVVDFPVKIIKPVKETAEEPATTEAEPVNGASCSTLPSLHVTTTDNLMRMLERSNIFPFNDNLFNIDLTYFTYGKPYFIGKSKSNRMPFHMPCCLIVDTNKIAPYYKIFPFDTGAFSLGKYADYLGGDAVLDHYKIGNNIEDVQWYIDNYFLSNNNYLSNKSIGDEKATIKHNHGLLKLLQSQRYFDTRSNTIELITDKKQNLHEILKAIVVPYAILSSKEFNEIMLKYPSVDVLPYHSIPSTSPEFYYDLLYQRVFDFVNAKDGLTKSSEPTIFVSYSWDSIPHRQRVENLVKRLRSEGFSVIYDADVVYGEQLTEFMERSITNSDYTVLICTPQYKDRADNRKGGVGYENSIITADLLEKKNDKKFIPVLFSGTWSDSLPNWAKGKLGVQYTDADTCEDDIQKLIRYLKKRDSKEDADK